MSFDKGKILKNNQALRSAKRNATLVLLVAIIIYCASFFTMNSIAREFLRTAGEAGTVGGLADWFAVTALFRHPLGIPIPHTALIPKQKDKIGSSIASFVQNNFLNKENLILELRNTDRGKQFGQWITNDEICSILANLIAETLQNAVRRGVQLDILRLILPTARRIRIEMRGEIEELIAKITGRLVPGIFDKLLTDRIAQELDRYLALLEVENSNERLALDAWFRVQVESIPDHLHGQVKKIALEMKNPEVLSKMGDGLPPLALITSIAEAIKSFGITILQSEEFRSKINNNLETSITTYVVPFREQIGSYIEKTVKSWDTKTITESLENQVGKDLQFIRISGTVVGMAAGIALFIISRIFTIL
jgi:uncharacterized membrane-anchored protein YjiN (DUF445 family)